MADRTVTAVLRANVSSFTASMAQASASTKAFSSDLEKNAAKNSQGFTQLGIAAGAFGVALAAGVASAVMSFANFDESMSHVQAATHETAANMDLLRQAALDAGARTAYSATEAAGAVEELAKAGLSTADIMGGALTGALNLAAAGGLDVAEAAETTATALSVFGLEGDQASHVADLLAAGAGKAQGSVQDMGMALNQSSLLANQMGLSVDETTGVLAEFASAGLKGSDAGTSFRQMLLHLSNPSVDAAATMHELGINVYDATGNFIGMEAVAGQLQTQMSGLTQETRDAAMANIFGADAVRAASILYDDGAAGVAEWADKVNDSGYAAETAALRMDNLKGDLEKLSGSIETTLISLGEGADGPLRALTQNLTNVVNAIGELPGWAQQGVLALGAITAAVTLLGGAALILIPKIQATRLALASLGVTARGATLAMGGIGIALTGIALVVEHFASAQADAKARADAFAASLDDVTGAVTANTRAWADNELATQDGFLGSKGASDAADALGISMDVLTSAYLGSASAIEQVQSALDRARSGQTNFTGGTMQAAQAISTVEDALEQGRQAIEDYEEATGAAATAASEASDAIRNQKADIEGTGAAFKVVATTATDTAAEQVKAADDAADAYSRQAEEIHGVIDAQRELSGDVMSAAEAQAAYQQSLDDLDATIAGITDEFGSLDEALNENKTGFDLNTQSGRDLQDAVFDVAKTQVDAAQGAYDLAEATGGDLVQANADLVESLTTSRDNLSQTLQDMGIGKEAADTLAASIVNVPDLSKTEVEVEDAVAKQKIADHDYAIRHLPTEWTTKLFGDETDAVAAAKAARDAVSSVPVRHDTYYYGHYEGEDQYESGTGGGHYASGGWITHRPGGMRAVVGEGGEDEAIIPEGKLRDILQGAVDFGRVLPMPAHATDWSASTQLGELVQKISDLGDRLIYDGPPVVIHSHNARTADLKDEVDYAAQVFTVSSLVPTS